MRGLERLFKDLIDCYDVKGVLQELLDLRDDVMNECDNAYKLVGVVELAQKIKEEGQWKNDRKAVLL